MASAFIVKVKKKKITKKPKAPPIPDTLAWSEWWLPSCHRCGIAPQPAGSAGLRCWPPPRSHRRISPPAQPRLPSLPAPPERGRARRALRALLPPRPTMALPGLSSRGAGATAPGGLAGGAATTHRRGSRPFRRDGEASFRRGPRSNGGAGGEAAALPPRGDSGRPQRLGRDAAAAWLRAALEQQHKGDPRGWGGRLPPAGDWRSGSRWRRRRRGNGTGRAALRAPPLAEPYGTVRGAVAARDLRLTAPGAGGGRRPAPHSGPLSLRWGPPGRAAPAGAPLGRGQLQYPRRGNCAKYGGGQGAPASPSPPAGLGAGCVRRGEPGGLSPVG